MKGIGDDYIEALGRVSNHQPQKKRARRKPAKQNAGKSKKEPMAVNFPPLPPLLSSEDMAALGIMSARKARRLCREGALPCVRVGKNWKIRRDEAFALYGIKQA